MLLVAAVLRFLLLSMKPPHFDEGINGWWVDQIWEKGFYEYDPFNYHGPFHFYLLQLSELLFGHNIFALRLVTAVFSLLAVWIVFLHGKYMGRVAFWAGAALAVSPAMVFYGRYAIHETDLVFFLVLFSYGFLQYHFEKTVFSVYIMVFAFAGMMLTKETYVIHVTAAVLSWIALRISERIRSARPFFTENMSSPPRSVASAMSLRACGTPSSHLWLPVIVAAVFMLYVFYSGFFLHPKGFWDFFGSLIPWTKTGVGHTGHNKPIYYWLELMFVHKNWAAGTYRMGYEWPLGLALVFGTGVFFAGFLGLVQTSKWFRWFTLNGIAVFCAYSIVPYKTPWCIESVIWPWAFVLGYLVEWLMVRREIRIGAIVVLFLVFLQNIRMTYLVNFVNFEKESEPYVYVQSTSDVWTLDHRVNALVRKYPHEANMIIRICLKSYWPLPWLWVYQTGLSYCPETLPSDLDADLVLIDDFKKDEAEKRFKEKYFREKIKIRGAQEQSFVYYRQDKFKEVLPEGLEVFEPMAESEGM